MQLVPLTFEFAQKHLTSLVNLAHQIPETNLSAETILADKKETRLFHGKWQRSLALMDGEILAGYMMGYERAGEANSQYPTPTIYIAELAVDLNYRGQGLGKKLIQAFLDHNSKVGMLVFPETPINFSLQTNSAEFNKSVRDLYAKFGFKLRTTKVYPNRVDVVMGYLDTQSA